MEPNSLLRILKEAIKAVPAVKYALGVAGIAVVVALVAGFGIDYRVAVLGISIMLVLMFALVLFSRFSKYGPKDVRPLAFTLAWASVFLIIGVALLLFTSFFFRWPLNLEQYSSANHLSPTTDLSNASPSPSPFATPENPKPTEKPAPAPSVRPEIQSRLPLTKVSQHIRRARSLYEQRNYQAAISECDEALRIDPKNNEATVLRSQIVNTVKILNR